MGLCTAHHQTCRSLRLALFRCSPKPLAISETVLPPWRSSLNFSDSPLYAPNAEQLYLLQNIGPSIGSSFSVLFQPLNSPAQCVYCDIRCNFSTAFTPIASSVNPSVHFSGSSSISNFTTSHIKVYEPFPISYALKRSPFIVSVSSPCWLDSSISSSPSYLCSSSYIPSAGFTFSFFTTPITAALKLNGDATWFFSTIYCYFAIFFLSFSTSDAAA